MRWIILCVGLLTACTATPKTGDDLVDAVVARQLPLAGSPCVAVGGPTAIVKPEAEAGPPATLTAQAVKNAEARRAAQAIALNWRDIQAGTPRLYGAARGQDCAMHVNGPAYSKDFAFVSYASPNGEMGAYVFRKADSRWDVIEQVKLGYW